MRKKGYKGVVIIQIVVIRTLDSQGRITLPYPVRQKLKINPQDSFLITCENKAIVMQKKKPNTQFRQFSPDGFCCFSGQIVLSKDEARTLLDEWKKRR